MNEFVYKVVGDGNTGNLVFPRYSAEVLREVCEYEKQTISIGNAERCLYRDPEPSFLVRHVWDSYMQNIEDRRIKREKEEYNFVGWANDWERQLRRPRTQSV